MKLWFLIIHEDDAQILLAEFLDEGLEAYAIASTGSFLRHGSVTIVVAVPTGAEATVQQLLDDYAQTRIEVRTAGLSEGATNTLGELAPSPLLVTTTGAIVFAVNVVRHEHW